MIVALTLVATSTEAHHSIAGVYDSTQRVTIDGAVVEFRFVNPHPYLVVNVTAPDQRNESWRLELDNRSELVDVGMTAGTIKSGDRIVAIGSPTHDGSHSLYVRRIDRGADGFWYEQVGSSPRIGRR